MNQDIPMTTAAPVVDFTGLAPERSFVLLTTEGCHDELATLDSPNVRRLCVAPEPTALADGDDKDVEGDDDLSQWALTLDDYNFKV